MRPNFGWTCSSDQRTVEKLGYDVAAVRLASVALCAHVAVMVLPPRTAVAILMAGWHSSALTPVGIRLRTGVTSRR